MFEIFKTINKKVREYNNLAENNKFMTNPFIKPSNQTIVWTEKKRILK